MPGKITIGTQDFENEWQMHKGLGYFAKKAVNNQLSMKTE